MSALSFDQLQLGQPAVRDRLATGRTADAAALASALAAESLSDLATTHVAAGRVEQGIAMMKTALQVNPACRSAFHNLIAVLLKAGALRNQALKDIWSHLLQQGRSLPWAKDYRALFFLPRFLNIEFVRGRCNLKCRMCIGINNPRHPNKLDSLPVEDFRRILENAPTISGVTLSSGDSDPLLHPEIDAVIEIARQMNVMLDLYTNGLPLSSRTARRIIDSGNIGTINFSMDAATSETYAKIRGGDHAKLLAKIRMLQEMKREAGAKLPRVSVSFVAMADTIHELPDFVALAIELAADQIIVDDLSGWLGDSHGNHPASDHPRAGEFLNAASLRARTGGIELQLHEGLRRLLGEFRATEPRSDLKKTPGDAHHGNPTHEGRVLAQHLHLIQDHPRTAGDQLACCGWIDGVWVNNDGRLQPCCMVRNPADMGSIHDGPLHRNEKYNRVKSLLLTGKVFESCTDQRMCRYIQERKASGRPLEIISEEELGDLAPAPVVASISPDVMPIPTVAAPSEARSLSLPVVQTV